MILIPIIFFYGIFVLWTIYVTGETKESKIWNYLIFGASALILFSQWGWMGLLMALCLPMTMAFLMTPLVLFLSKIGVHSKEARGILEQGNKEDWEEAISSIKEITGIIEEGRKLTSSIKGENQ